MDLLPTDGCDRCLTLERSFPVHPFRVVPCGEGIRADYRCPRCGLTWWTGWTISALETPCPGCETCTPKARQA